MLYDSHKRKIDYLRLSVTDRCNLRCRYCMPETGVKPKPHSEILTYEEIERFAVASVKAGISRIRLTGGEPLIRRDILNLVKMLAGIPGLEDISLTTNGLLLPEYGGALREAGLNRINISLDSLDPTIYHKLTRLGDLNQALRGVRTAIDFGFMPVKINVVLIRGVNDDPHDFLKLVYDYPVHVRFIEFMPVGFADVASYVSIGEFENKLADCAGKDFSGLGSDEQENGREYDRLGNKKSVFEDDFIGKEPKGAGPARYVSLRGALGTIGFIDAVSNHFCDRCNRIRLTPDGKLRLCLFSDAEFDIRKLLRANVSEKGLISLIREAILEKPQKHNIDKIYNEEMETISGSDGADKLVESNGGIAEENRRERMMNQIGG